MFVKAILNLRSNINTKLFPSSKYFLGTRNLKPLSSKYGLDRGAPIDRYYIDKYVSANRDLIHGVCLEIGDNRYTKTFGKNVSKSDVLDVVKTNKKANIIGDLKSLKGQIKDNTYDCIILTQVLGMIDDIDAVVKELYRILKAGGAIIVTSSAVAPVHDIDRSYWRFTQKSLGYLFSKVFNISKVNTRSFGNVLVGQCFWVGMSQEELTQKELDYFDPHYPLIIGLTAKK